MADIQFQQMVEPGILPRACKFLKLDHYINSSYEKSIVERTKQYIKDRIGLMTIFHAEKEMQTKAYTKIGPTFFVDHNNGEVISTLQCLML